MTQEYLRVYQTFDLEDVKGHLLIMGDLSGDCGACRELGIDTYTAQDCPNCKTHFKYLSCRRLESHPGERFHLARRMHEKRPDLIHIDYADYQKALGKKQARDFFA